MEKFHVIHSRAGRIGGRADTLPVDVDAIVTSLRADPRRHLVLHFHGGLVSKESGLAIADKLMHEYAPTPQQGGYPVFFVWESGAWETIRNNLTELADEPVFKQVLRKLVQYALERLGGQEVAGTGVGRSVFPGSCGSRETEVRKAFETFWSTPSPASIPLRGMDALVAPVQARSSIVRLDQDEIQADLESDVAFQSALASLPGLPAATRSAFAPAGVREHRSLFSEMAAAEFSKSSNSRGLVELVQVARFLIKVLAAVLKRRANGRDHGLYATCVEEAVRAFKIAGSGLNQWGQALEWNRMKQDTIDAFGPDPQVHAGTALLARLRDAFGQGMVLDRITLVGHSTGAIYIANWLERSRDFLPACLKQDVVFLAPAITYERFARTLVTEGARIGGFRLFGMQDVVERDDQVWGSDEELNGTQDWRRYIYPSSLLYLVSGVLETRSGESGQAIDEADVPLVGLQRFLYNENVYSEAHDTAFKSVDVVRAWLKSQPDRLVWSVTNGAPDGRGCTSVDHGAFDDDATTRASLRHIVCQGY